MTQTSPAREVEFEPVYQHYGPPALACQRSFLTSVSCGGGALSRLR
jgi:hypothetical protein